MKRIFVQTAFCGLALLCWLAGVGKLPGAEPAAVQDSKVQIRQLPRDDLLVYQTNDGREKPVRTIDDWLLRRNQILEGMQAVMGKLPGNEKRCPLDIQIE